MDKAAKVGIYIAAIGLLMTGISFLRDLFDYKIEPYNQVNSNTLTTAESPQTTKKEITPLKIDSLMGTLFIERDNSISGIAVSYKIYINEIYYDKIKCNQKKTIQLKPGEYKVALTDFWGNEGNEIRFRINPLDSIIVKITTPLNTGIPELVKTLTSKTKVHD